ncbi:MAG: YggS family pyridoxal phosphate-dependent enzyme [Chromatiales bacterium]|jgi:pyridoxal phosphate enzyme (YggS family)
MNDIEKNLQQVHLQIRQQCEASGRSPDEVTLLAVSKTKPVSDIMQAYAQGQRDFGENYLQEAEQKITALAGKDIIWHYIGPIQSNKTHKISELFDWVHSVDRLKIARHLSRHRPPDRKPLNILLQINIDNEASKSGIPLDNMLPLAHDIAQLPHLMLRGLMAIPAVRQDFAAQREPFGKMHDALERLKQHYPQCDCLSMGMSSDMQAAIAEGSTLVRIGTAIFGARA